MGGTVSGGGSTGGSDITVSDVDRTVTLPTGSDDATLRGTVLAQEDGVYQILGEIPDNCAAAVDPAELVYFKVTNNVAGAGFTLTISNEDGVPVYRESYTACVW